ncbi:MAG: D-tyrosyl-tRNA(Tyr) deacylase [Dehalococcoidia bacterium]|nr:D-tyrosyl-tRNA(Tyr) deacylase [Dehalococcoidia bacterium]
MKALIQRVTSASVSVSGREVGRIGPGLVVFIGVARDDSQEGAGYLAKKIVNLRIFSDEGDKFALSALETKKEILIVSQFTLLADSGKGRRPSFTEAAPPDKAKELYDFFVDQVRSSGLKVETGIFQEYMLVEIHNDGPVTLLLESKKSLKIN